MESKEAPEEAQKDATEGCCMDPNANHSFKTISLRLNEWEDTQLSTAAQETGRSKTCFIRWAIRQQASKVL